MPFMQTSSIKSQKSRSLGLHKLSMDNHLVHVIKSTFMVGFS